MRNWTLSLIVVAALCGSLLARPVFAREPQLDCPTLLTRVSRNTLLRRTVRALYRKLLHRRYQVTVVDVGTATKGLKNIKSRGTKGILFLFEHPGLIDPILMYSEFGDDFQPRPLIAEVIAKRMMPLVRGTRALIVPEVNGTDASAQVNQIVEEVARGLTQGDNFMIAPSGQIKRGNKEIVGTKSIVEKIVKANPSVRIVLIRSQGIYGSTLSTGKTGIYPDPKALLNESTLKALILGTPKRPVRIEVKDAIDFPKTGTREQMNRYLEDFYNSVPKENLYVGFNRNEPTYIAPAVEPPTSANHEAAKQAKNEILSGIDPAIKKQVIDTVTEEAKFAGTNENTTIDEIGLDSLKVVEMYSSLEKKLNISLEVTDYPQTVGDIIISVNQALLRKNGKLAGSPELTKAIRVDPRWFYGDHINSPVKIPAGQNIAKVFLKQARANPDRVIIVDEASGAKTYRDLMLGIYALRPLIKKISGQYVGIMMPAGVGATVMYLATVFAGKTPVMVNYTMGEENMKSSLDLLGVQKVLTAKAFVDRLEKKNIKVGSIKDKFLMVEDLRAAMTKRQQLMAFARSAIKYFWTAPSRWRISPISVVLFTSGSSAAPKAVPLTHQNQLTNIRDAIRLFEFQSSDKILAFLPPFHSFGNTANQIMPILAGIPTVYTPDPTDYRAIANLTEAYKPTMVMGTPTFLTGIADKAKPGQLDSLKIAMAGAEALKADQVEKLKRANPNLTIIEGYGTTEASPIVAGNSPNEPRFGSVGRALYSVRTRIVNAETLAPVAPGEPGMLYLQGPSIFGGYLNASESQNPFRALPGERGLWYETGDIFVQSADGHLTIVGRLSRFRKKGGEMISLPAIEAKLTPLFEDPSADGPTIAVESAEDNAPTVLFTTINMGKSTDQLRQWVRLKQQEMGMSPTSFIDEVRIVDKIPILGTGKTDYKVLKGLLNRK